MIQKRIPSSAVRSSFDLSFHAPLAYLIERLGLGEGRVASFHIVSMDRALLMIDVWIDKRETVRVPAGEFDCHRVRMRPNLESLFPNLPAVLRPVVSMLVDADQIWLTAEGPPRMVRFKGQLGPPGSLDVDVRLVDIRDSAPPHTGALPHPSDRPGEQAPTPTVVERRS